LNHKTSCLCAISRGTCCSTWWKVIWKLPTFCNFLGLESKLPRALLCSSTYRTISWLSSHNYRNRV